MTPTIKLYNALVNAIHQKDAQSVRSAMETFGKVFGDRLMWGWKKLPLFGDPEIDSLIQATDKCFPGPRVPPYTMDF